MAPQKLKLWCFNGFFTEVDEKA